MNCKHLVLQIEPESIASAVCTPCIEVYRQNIAGKGKRTGSLCLPECRKVPGFVYPQYFLHQVP